MPKPRKTRDDAESLTADAPPITPEEIQELRERLGRGELSEEEAREAFLRLREQFGGGQGGFGPGGFGGAQAAGTIESIDGNTITRRDRTRRGHGHGGRECQRQHNFGPRTGGVDR